MNFLSNRFYLLGRKCYKDGILSIGKRLRSDEAASGQSSKLKKVLENIPKDRINARDGRGWTALMLAAREGEAAAIDILVDKGAQTDLLTPSGHSAYDVAVYWRREECAKLLKPIFIEIPTDNFFAYDGLQRHSGNRTKKTWLADVLHEDSSQFILMRNAEPLVTFDSKTSPKAKLTAQPSLLYLPYEKVHHLIEDSLSNIIYLGTWSRQKLDMIERKAGSKYIEKNVFSVDVSKHEENYLQELYPNTEVLPAFPGLLRLNKPDASLCAQARSLLDWHVRYQYCASCGSAMMVCDTGYKQTCSNKGCTSHKGNSNVCHPRVDPTVIAAVLSRDNENVLLARQKAFPPGMYSCIAGFVEPGESIEIACRREVEEEVGIYINKVVYHSSQPWPMPSTLMIGCTAYADHDLDIQLDKEELEDARWFPREEVVLMIMRHHTSGYFVPPPQALAHRLVNDWLVKTAFD